MQTNGEEDIVGAQPEPIIVEDEEVEKQKDEEDVNANPEKAEGDQIDSTAKPEGEEEEDPVIAMNDDRQEEYHEEYVQS